MNNIDKPTDPVQPLEKIKHERFAHMYAGKCFGFAGRAYRQAGYKCKSNASSYELGSKLLRNIEVLQRIEFLRRGLVHTMGIDAIKILEERMAIVNSKAASASDRLAALRDIERSLGLDRPQRFEANQSGSVLVIDVGRTAGDKKQLVIQ